MDVPNEDAPSEYDPSVSRGTFARLVRENILEVEAACRIVPAAAPCPDDLLKKDRVAAMLAVSLKTLERWRSEGRGPMPTKVEGLVRYRYRDLLVWLNEQADK